MCGWALRLFGVGKVYYGASNPRFGGNGSVYDFHCCGGGRSEKTNTRKELAGCQSKGLDYESHGGILEEETIDILKRFYAQENDNGKLTSIWVHTLIA